MIKLKNENKGFLTAVIVIVIALLILSYFGFNLRQVADSPTTRDNFSYVTQFVVDLWTNYLKGPALYIWNDIILKVINSKG